MHGQTHIKFGKRMLDVKT